MIEDPIKTQLKAAYELGLWVLADDYKRQSIEHQIMWNALDDMAGTCIFHQKGNELVCLFCNHAEHTETCFVQKARDALALVLDNQEHKDG